MLSIMGYSLYKNIAPGKFLESNIFDVDGHDWSIQYYPNGSEGTSLFGPSISIFLALKSKSEFIRAKVSFTILDQNGCVLPFSKTTKITNFETQSRNIKNLAGYSRFARRAELESNIKDDCFVIKSVVTVFKSVHSISKDFPVDPTAQIIVPPSNIQQQLGHLLEAGNGADVTFEVDGQTLRGHKCILATRSPVFWAEFFGPMKEKFHAVIKIEEMETPVFKALLHFIYNDSLPGFEEAKESDKKHDSKLMVQHLLVAADRYCLERLKIMCEKMLCGSIDISNVISLLSLAERHKCFHLKTVCLKFIASSDSIGEVVATEEFQDLVKNDPLIFKELLEKRG